MTRSIEAMGLTGGQFYGNGIDCRRSKPRHDAGREEGHLRFLARHRFRMVPVSYTHLTLPTNREV